MTSQEVLTHFESQAAICEKMGSPFSAELCRLIPEIFHGSVLGNRIRGWPGDAEADALALRACGGFHALVLRNLVPRLSAAYPPQRLDRAELKLALESATAQHDAFLTDYLDGPPQTNEAGRSSMILGAALQVSRVTGRPLEIFELGASAGLNLWFADYAYDFGAGGTWGSARAPLTIASDWSGDLPPLDQPLTIVGRHACDQNPLDATTSADCMRLTSYVWPDQTARLDRVRRALGHAALQNVCVEKADAADWVVRQLSHAGDPGCGRMIYHTVFWQYLPEATRIAITRAVHAAAVFATRTSPLAWFRFESDGGEGGEGGAMDLTIWPGGQSMRLGRADFHGRWVRWEAAAIG